MRTPVVLVAMLAGCAAPLPGPPVQSAPDQTRASCDGEVVARQARFRRLLARRGEAAEPKDVVRRVLAECGTADAVALTRRLVGFQTVAAIAPVARHPQFAAMASFLAQWAQEASLQFRVAGAHDAWEVTLPGRRDGRSLAVIAHADVVPVNDPPSMIAASEVPAGWTVPAFQGVLKDGRLYGRGTEDDKGPIAAMLVALRELRAAGIVPQQEITLAMGTAEEDDWEGMRRYASSAPKALRTVSVDADYPVVVAQSGFVSWGFRAPVGEAPSEGSRAWIRELHGGLFLTQVPDQARVVFEPRGETVQQLRERLEPIIAAELERRRAQDPSFVWRFELEAVTPGAVSLTVHGKAVHSSVAEQGHNALWPLAVIASKVGIAPGGAKAVLESIAAEFDGDHHGERLGVFYQDPFMGKLLVAPTVLRMHDGWVTLEVNMRRPQGRSDEQFRALLDAALQRLRQRHGGAIEAVPRSWVGAPHVVEPGSELVVKLSGIYRDLTGRVGEPRALRGGTYARLFEGAVDFGPGMEGRPYSGHGTDEYIGLDALGLSVRAAGELALRLGCDAL